VKRDKATLDRLNIFINVYSFCRNMAFAMLLAAAVIAASGIWYAAHGLWEPNLNKVGIAVLCVCGAVGMLYRYLSFYRRYIQEVLITYPELKRAKEER
jgi:magnesium-transporting ATPase (P-type)